MNPQNLLIGLDNASDGKGVFAENVSAIAGGFDGPLALVVAGHELPPGFDHLLRAEYFRRVQPAVDPALALAEHIRLPVVFVFFQDPFP